MHKLGHHLPAACEEGPASPARCGGGRQSPPTLTTRERDRSRQEAGVTDGPAQPLPCQHGFPRAQVASGDRLSPGMFAGIFLSSTKPGLDGVFHGMLTGGGTGPAVPSPGGFAAGEASHKGTFGSACGCLVFKGTVALFMPQDHVPALPALGKHPRVPVPLQCGSSRARSPCSVPPRSGSHGRLLPLLLPHPQSQHRPAVQIKGA